MILLRFSDMFLQFPVMLLYFQILLNPESGTITVGRTSADFRVSDLAADQDLVLRVFVDKYLVEVFVSDLQAVCDTNMKWSTNTSPLGVYTWGASTTISSVGDEALCDTQAHNARVL